MGRAREAWRCKSSSESVKLELMSERFAAVGLKKNGAAALFDARTPPPLDLLSGGDEWAGILAIEERDQAW
jgi:hypothetical protein